jgi:hypothetical protein
MANKGKPAKKRNAQEPAFIISDKVGNYEKHPYFVKKANDAKELIKKYGLPNEVVKTK